MRGIRASFESWPVNIETNLEYAIFYELDRRRSKQKYPEFSYNKIEWEADHHDKTLYAKYNPQVRIAVLYSDEPEKYISKCESLIADTLIDKRYLNSMDLYFEFNELKEKISDALFHILARHDYAKTKCKMCP